jgi:hypothetical protein
MKSGHPINLERWPVMDTSLRDEMEELREFADAHPEYESVFIDYLIATQSGDEERARTAKAFLLFYQQTS